MRRVVVLDHLVDRIAGDDDALPGDALAQQVLAAALRVRHQHRAAVIDDPPVHFLGHAVVVAAVARFHVKDRNAEPPRDDRRQAAVGVAEDRAADPAGARSRSASIPPRICPTCAPKPSPRTFIRTSGARTPSSRKTVVQPFVVVLAGVDEHVRRRARRAAG